MCAKDTLTMGVKMIILLQKLSNRIEQKCKGNYNVIHIQWCTALAKAPAKVVVNGV